MEFIQVAAHELRTPLTVLKGYANLLRNTGELKANPALGEVLDGILKGTERMHGVVNTMLDVTRIDNETLRLSAAPVLLKQLIAETLNEFAKAASERTLQLVHVPEADLPLVYGDPTLIHKALQQLIVNAIKYTPDGGKVTVSTRAVTMEDGRPAVEVRVTDTGIGLDKEHHELVFGKVLPGGVGGRPFDRFHQLQRRRTGSGAGDCARCGARARRQSLGGKRRARRSELPRLHLPFAAAHLAHKNNAPAAIGTAYPKGGEQGGDGRLQVPV
ncbi:MAG: HAMP domain-containing histidine kinase [Chloroflexi bacterium]|nr:HAMP domain-containing histidine kinase [Chloroflexota bacterium]